MRYQALEGALVVEELPQKLRKGIHFGTLMSGFGWFFRNRPDGMTIAEQEKLYAYSVYAKRMAYFFSHCWRSPGYQKYMALLLSVLAPFAGVMGLLGMLAVYLFQVYYKALPCVTMTDIGYGLTFCETPWEFIVGVVVTWIFLLVGPYFVCDKQGFLDAVCIAQAPLDLKLEGIKHLPSFLAASEELIIAWDPLYFTRGWCVYELAMYKGLFPNRPITILPIKFYTSMFACSVGNVIPPAIFLIIYPIIGDVVGPSFLAMLAFTSVIAKIGEELDREKQVLQHQLTNFDFEMAQVQVQADRDEIIRCINMYYAGGLEEFNRIVRTEIRDEVLGNFASCRAVLPYKMMMIAACPFVPFMTSYVSSFRQFGPAIRIAHAISCYTWPFFCLPCMMAGSMQMAAWMRKPEEDLEDQESVPWRWRHLLIGFLSCCFVGTYNALFYLIPMKITGGSFPSLTEQQRWYGVPLAAFGSVMMASITLYLFAPRNISVKEAVLALSPRAKSPSPRDVKLSPRATEAKEQAKEPAKEQAKEQAEALLDPAQGA